MEATQTETLEFRLNSWMENAAICGLVNILGESNVTVNDQSVVVPLEAFNDFEEKYFAHFVKEYKKQSSYTKILNYKEIKEKHELTNFEAFEQSDYTELQKYLSDLKRYGESNSYKAVYPLVSSNENILGLLKKAKLKNTNKNAFEKNPEKVMQDVRRVYEVLNKVFAYFELPDVKRYLPAKVQIYTTINKGYKDVSFLNRQESQGDFFVKYHDYFVTPIFEYMEQNHEKDKLHCANCARRIKKGDISYSFINQAGYDVNRKPSNAWDFTNDLFMCPICRLLYSCIPAGFTYVYSQGLFINDNHSVNDLLRINNGVSANVLHLNKQDVKTTNIYAELIRTLQEENLHQEKKALNDIQVVRYENDRYYFNILPKRILKTISFSENELTSILNSGYTANGEYQSVYQGTVSRLMNSTNLFSLIHQTLYYKLTTSQVRMNAKQIIDLLQINTNFLKELTDMGEFTKEDLKKIRRDGYFFRNKYDNPNKAKSVGQKLLNALRASDIDGFMDTLLNSYNYLNKIVPAYFNDVFLNEELFKTIGYAFVTGMIGERETEIGGKDNE